MITLTKSTDVKPVFGLRKFKVGLCAAVIGSMVLMPHLGNTVEASKTPNNDKPDDEANNDAIKKEAQTDVSGTTTSTITSVHDSNTTVKKLPQNEQKQEKTKPHDTNPTGSDDVHAKINSVQKSKNKATDDQKSDVNKQINTTKKNSNTNKNTTTIQLTKSAIDRKANQNLQTLINNSANLVDNVEKNKLITLATRQRSINPLFNFTTSLISVNANEVPYQTEVDNNDGKPNPYYPKLTIDNWRDPNSWDLVKTPIGYTTKQQATYWQNHMAKKSDTFFAKPDGSHPNALNEATLKTCTFDNSKLSLKATIDKNLLNQGSQDILLAAIPVLTNDIHYKQHGHYGNNDWLNLAGINIQNNTNGANVDGICPKVTSNTGVYDQDGRKLGFLYCQNHDTVLEYIFHYEKPQDKTFSDDFTINFFGDGWQTDKNWPGNYNNLVKAAPYDVMFVNPDGTTAEYDMHYTPSEDDVPWSRVDHFSQNKNTRSTPLYWHLYYDNRSYDIPYNNTENHHNENIVRTTYFDANNNIIDTTPTNDVGSLISTQLNIYGPNNKQLTSYRYDLSNPIYKAHILPDNLSVKDIKRIMDESAKNNDKGVFYSKQSDGSFLRGTIWDTNDVRYTDQQIIDAVNSSYYLNVQHPEEKEAWAKETLDTYHRRNNTPTCINTYIVGESFMPADKAYSVIDEDVTPGQTPTKIIGTGMSNTNDGFAKFMQTNTILYVDDDSNQQVASQTILGAEGATYHYTAVDMHIPNQYVLADPSVNVNYTFLHDHNIPLVVHLKQKVIGTTGNLVQNATNTRDYLLNEYKNKANVTIIHDQAQDYKGNLEDANSVTDAFNKANDDLVNQTNDIASQIKTYETQLQDYNKNPKGNPPKLVLHYHDVTVSPTKHRDYKVVLRMPKTQYGQDQTLVEWAPDFVNRQARNMATGYSEQSDTLESNQIPVGPNKYAHATFSKKNNYWTLDNGDYATYNGSSQMVVLGKYVALDDLLPGYKLKDEPRNSGTGQDITFYNPSKRTYTSSTDWSAIPEKAKGYITLNLLSLTNSTWYNPFETPDSFTHYVDLVPNEQTGTISYVDEDTGEVVSKQVISGTTDQTNHITYVYDTDNYVIDTDRARNMNYNVAGKNYKNYPWLTHATPEGIDITWSNSDDDNGNWKTLTQIGDNNFTVYVKQKEMKPDTPGNVIDPIANLITDNTDPNIKWVEDPTKVQNVNDDDPNQIRQASDNAIKDYNDQEDSIRAQLANYQKQFEEYKNKRADYIKQLKDQGLINDTTVDPSTLGQHLYLPSEAGEKLTFDILDPTFVTNIHDTNNIEVKHQNHQGDFLKATYTNLHNLSYDGKHIGKIVVTYSNWQQGSYHANDQWAAPLDNGLSIYPSFGDGYNYKGAKSVDSDIQMFYDNGTQITFDKQSIMTIGSLNSLNNSAEQAQLLSPGKAYAIPGSDVTVHNGNALYDDLADDQGNKRGKHWDWGNADNNPNYYVGAGLFDITGSNHIKMRTSNTVRPTHKDDVDNGILYNQAWVTHTTSIPQMAFDKQKPTLTIHWHKNQIVSHLDRNYNVIYSYPSEAEKASYVNHSSVHYTRNIGVNFKTKAIEYGQYKLTNSDNMNLNTIKQIPLDWTKVDGYDIKSNIPNNMIIGDHQGISYSKNGGVYNNDPSTLANSYTYHVFYTPGEVQGVIRYIDDTTGQVVKTDSIHGRAFSETPVVYNIPMGYILEPNQDLPKTTVLQAGKTDTTLYNCINVYLTHDTLKINETREVPVTIKYETVNADGTGKDNTIYAPHIKMTRTKYTDAITGQSTYGDWDIDTSGYNSAFGNLNLNHTDPSDPNLDFTFVNKTKDKLANDFGISLDQLNNSKLTYTLVHGSYLPSDSLPNKDGQPGYEAGDLDLNSDYSVDLNDPDAFDYNNAGKTPQIVLTFYAKPDDTLYPRNVAFVDNTSDDIVADTTIKGENGTTVPIDVPDILGYKIVPGQNLTGKIDKTKTDDPIIIYVNRITIHVPHTHPVNYGDLIEYENIPDGAIYPNGLSYDDLNRTITRTIYFNYSNGTTDVVKQTVKFYRDADYDPIGNTVKYTPWQTEGSASFDRVSVVKDGESSNPSIGGTNDIEYQDNKAVAIRQESPTPDDNNQVISVDYSVAPKLLVVFDDADMSDTEIWRKSYDAEKGTKITINLSNKSDASLSKYVDKDGYDYIATQNGKVIYKGSNPTFTYTATGNDDPIVIEKMHRVHTDYGYQINNQNLAGDKEVTQTINIHMPNGEIKTIKRSVVFQRGVFNDDTTNQGQQYVGYYPNIYYKTDINGHETYKDLAKTLDNNPDHYNIDDQFTFNAITLPTIDGYYVKGLSKDGLTVNSDSDSITQDVYYAPVLHETYIEYRDSNGKVLAHNVFHGYTNQTVTIPGGAPFDYIGPKVPVTYTFKADNKDNKPIIIQGTKIKSGKQYFTNDSGFQGMNLFSLPANNNQKASQNQFNDSKFAIKTNKNNNKIRANTTNFVNNPRLQNDDPINSAPLMTNLRSNLSKLRTNISQPTSAINNEPQNTVNGVANKATKYQTSNRTTPSSFTKDTTNNVLPHVTHFTDTEITPFNQGSKLRTLNYKPQTQTPTQTTNKHNYDKAKAKTKHDSTSLEILAASLASLTAASTGMYKYKKRKDPQHNTNKISK